MDYLWSGNPGNWESVPRGELRHICSSAVVFSCEDLYVCVLPLAPIASLAVCLEVVPDGA